MNKLDSIAYLAPEIPSVAGTFVYKEILTLQDKGIKVLPISIHKVETIVREQRVKELAENTTYLYQHNLTTALISSLAFFLKEPKSYLITLLMVFQDVYTLGITKLSSWKLLYQFIYASIAAQAIQENGCQYLHIHFAHVPTQIGMYASSLTKLPFSFTSHANDIFENKFLLKQKMERAKAGVTISQYNHRFLSERGINTDKLQVVRCGIDSSTHNFVPKTKISDIPVIGSLGRLIEKKGMDDTILALSKLHQQGIDFRLEIGGDGPLNNYLQEIVKKHDLIDKIEFKGIIPNDKVYDWLKNLDIFVLACKEDSKGDRDGIPVVLMEAMLMGVPVISTNISGIPELIQDEQSGFLAQPRDPDSLASTINKALHWPDLAQITQVARNKVTGEFELKNNVDRLLTVFNS